MPVTIGSNIASLRVQRALDRVNLEQSTTAERLSSGQRINRASDDAAGISIASGLNSSRKVYLQGIRNLGDGISALSIAEGSLKELTSIIQRQLELAEQSANGVYSGAQRQALNTESSALTSEYNRIVSTTQFNGRNLLDGSFRDVRMQAGFGVDGSIRVSIGSEIVQKTQTGTFTTQTTTSAVNDYSELVDVNGDGKADLVGPGSSLYVRLSNGDGTFAAALTLGSFSAIQGFAVGDLNNDGKNDLVGSDFFGNRLAVALGNGNGTFSAVSIQPSAFYNNGIALADFNHDGKLDVAIASSNTQNEIAIRLGGGDGSFSATASRVAASDPHLISTGDFNEDGNQDIVSRGSDGNLRVFLGDGTGGLSAGSVLATPGGIGTSPRVGDIDGDGHLDIVAASDGSTVSIQYGAGNGTFSLSTISGSGIINDVRLADVNNDGRLDILGANVGTGKVDINLNSGSRSFTSSSVTAAGGSINRLILGDTRGIGIQDVLAFGGATASVLLGDYTESAQVSDLSIATADDARSTLDSLGVRRERIARELGQIGGAQSRLQVASAFLGIQSDAYKAAESRIVDADIAQESANYVRQDIVKQAGAAVLSQANLQPSIALLLLKS